MTALSLLYYEMVEKRDIGRGVYYVRIMRYVTLERPNDNKWLGMINPDISC